MGFVQELSRVYPSECPHLAEVRMRYASWKWCYKSPASLYIVYAKGDNALYEHRLVAALAYGPIPDGYHVHHNNDLPWRNEADNLVVVRPSEHCRLHRNRPTVFCPICGCDFERVPSQLLRYKNYYCSLECARIGQRTIARPSHSELVQLVDANGYCATGRMFGVSDNAIRKWLRTTT